MAAAVRRFLGGVGLRQFSSRRTDAEESSDTLARWLREWMAVPRVVVPEGTEPPTALSWLRRRGPPLPESARQRLFRDETVRLYDAATERVGRVGKARKLGHGAMMLLPKAAVAEAAAAEHAARAGRELSPPQQRQHAAAADALRGRLLHSEPEWLALDKPAGLATQGGSGVSLSVDSLMGDSFGSLQGVRRPADLRLVHRLDRQTTGVLLVAKNPDAAAWLSAAFRDGSGSGSGSSGGRGRSPAVAAGISKTYWAVVARGGEDGLGPSSSSRAATSGGRAVPGRVGIAAARTNWLPPTGSVSLPVPSSRDGEQLQEAHTPFRVLRQSGTLAWLELQPSTGRKHQLRLHCAQGLGAAVLGDARYGALRAGAQEAALAALPQQPPGSATWGGASAPPLFLHCRSMEVRRPGGGRGSAVVTAPLPEAWRALFQQQGWPLPRD